MPETVSTNDEFVSMTLLQREQMMRVGGAVLHAKIVVGVESPDGAVRMHRDHAQYKGRRSEAAVHWPAYQAEGLLLAFSQLYVDQAEGGWTNWTVHGYIEGWRRTPYQRLLQRRNTVGGTSRECSLDRLESGRPFAIVKDNRLRAAQVLHGIDDPARGIMCLPNGPLVTAPNRELLIAYDGARIAPAFDIRWRSLLVDAAELARKKLQ